MYSMNYQFRKFCEKRFQIHLHKKRIAKKKKKNGKRIYKKGRDLWSFFSEVIGKWKMKCK